MEVAMQVALIGEAGVGGDVGIHSVQAPELPFDRRDESSESLRGQIRGEGLELPAGSSPRWERMAYDEPW